MKNMHDARDSAGPPHKDLRVFSTRTCEFSAQGPASFQSVSWQKGLCRCGQVQHLRWEAMLDYLGGWGARLSQGPCEQKMQSLGKVM